MSKIRDIIEIERTIIDKASIDDTNLSLVETFSNQEIVNRISSVSGGSSDLVGLSDTPSSYLGKNGGFLLVNDTADGVEFNNEVDLGTF